MLFLDLCHSASSHFCHWRSANWQDHPLILCQPCDSLLIGKMSPTYRLLKLIVFCDGKMSLVHCRRKEENKLNWTRLVLSFQRLWIIEPFDIYQCPFLFSRRYSCLCGLLIYVVDWTNGLIFFLEIVSLLNWIVDMYSPASWHGINTDLLVTLPHHFSFDLQKATYVLHLLSSTVFDWISPLFIDHTSLAIDLHIIVIRHVTSQIIFRWKANYSFCCENDSERKIESKLFVADWQEKSNEWSCAR